MRRTASRFLSVIVVIVAISSGCRPPETIDLEIVDVQAVTPPAAAGDVVSLQVQVRNNSRGPTAATVSAAVVADAASGHLRKGPPLEIRGGRTETLTLDVPAERPYLRACTLATNVFLAKPGDPGNLGRDLWIDTVPENSSRDVSFPLTRPLPTSIQVTEPIQEVVEPPPAGADFKRHYEATMRVLPDGASWAIDRRNLLVQTLPATGSETIEPLPALFQGGRLYSQSILWTGDVQRRDSVARATVHAQFIDCSGERRTLLAERVRVQLAPR